MRVLYADEEGLKVVRITSSKYLNGFAVFHKTELGETKEPDDVVITMKEESYNNIVKNLMLYNYVDLSKYTALNSEYWEEFNYIQNITDDRKRGAELARLSRAWKERLQ